MKKTMIRCMIFLGFSTFLISLIKINKKVNATGEVKELKLAFVLTDAERKTLMKPLEDLTFYAVPENGVKLSYYNLTLPEYGYGGYRYFKSWYTDSKLTDIVDSNRTLNWLEHNTIYLWPKWKTGIDNIFIVNSGEGSQLIKGLPKNSYTYYDIINHINSLNIDHNLYDYEIYLENTFETPYVRDNNHVVGFNRNLFIKKKQKVLVFHYNDELELGGSDVWYYDDIIGFDNFYNMYDNWHGELWEDVVIYLDSDFKELFNYYELSNYKDKKLELYFLDVSKNYFKTIINFPNETFSPIELKYGHYNASIKEERTYPNIPQSITNFNKILPTPDFKKGYKFLSWYSDLDLKQEFNDSTTFLIGNYDLYAKYEIIYQPTILGDRYKKIGYNNNITNEYIIGLFKAYDHFGNKIPIEITNSNYEKGKFGTFEFQLAAFDFLNNLITEITFTLEIVEYSLPEIKGPDFLTYEYDKNLNIYEKINNEYSAYDKVDGEIALFIKHNEIILNQLGEFKIILETRENSNGEIATKEITVIFIDTKAPEVVGDKNLTFENINELDFNEILNKFKITDNFDNNPTLKIISNNYIKDKLGTYNFKLKATDINDNFYEFDVKVNIIDTLAPVIEGKNVITLNYVKNLKNAEILKNYSVSDNFDKNPKIVVKSTNYKIGELGTFTYILYGLDNSNNKSLDFEITVILEDLEAPKISAPRFIKESYEKEITQEYLLSLFKITDNYGKNPEITFNLTNLKANEIGIYECEITAVDNSDNTTTLKFDIELYDNIKPVFKDSLKGEITINYNGNFSNKMLLLGLEVTDAIDGNLINNVKIAHNLINKKKGTHVVKYETVDKSGNIAEHERVYNLIIEPSLPTYFLADTHLFIERNKKLTEKDIINMISKKYEFKVNLENYLIKKNTYKGYEKTVGEYDFEGMLKNEKNESKDVNLTIVVYDKKKLPETKELGLFNYLGAFILRNLFLIIVGKIMILGGLYVYFTKFKKVNVFKFLNNSNNKNIKTIPHKEVKALGNNPYYNNNYKKNEYKKRNKGD